MQDATPITLGQEFSGYYGQVQNGIEKLNDSLKWLSKVALGGTAVGTGINTHKDFARLVCKDISDSTNLEIIETEMKLADLESIQKRLDKKNKKNVNIEELKLLQTAQKIIDEDGDLTLITNEFDEKLCGKEDRYWAQDVARDGHSIYYDSSLIAQHHYTENGSTWKGQSWSNSARTEDEETTADLSFPSDWTTTAVIDRWGVGSWSGYYAANFTLSDVSIKWDSGKPDIGWLS